MKELLIKKLAELNDTTGKKFLNTCSITIIDDKTHKKVIEYLQDIGYNVLFSARNHYGNIISTDKYGMVTSTPDVNSYDCNGDIELFKALTAMNDRNDYMQLFVDKYDEWYLCQDQCVEDDLPNLIAFEFPSFHKATTKEVIEYYKTKK